MARWLVRIGFAIGLGLLFGGLFWIGFSPRWYHVPSVRIVAEPFTFPGFVHVVTPPVVREPTAGLHLLFVGDMMFDRNVADRSTKAKDLAYPFQRLPVGWFSSFDSAIGNLEGPVTDRRRAPEKSIDFLFQPAIASLLKEEGFSLVSQANNHALDQGSLGYADSIRRLNEAGLLAFGHQVQDGDVALATTTVKNVKLAFVGFNTTDRPLDKKIAQATLEKARGQSDVVIVMPHWGLEYKDQPEAGTRELAHWFIDQGADVVIGGHPHWVQGIESYKNKPIVYSLGNFIFDQDFSQKTREGMGIELNWIDGEISIVPMPIFIEKSQPRVLEGEEKTKRLKELAEISGKEVQSQVEQGLVKFDGSQ